jgi:hypothetical protein
MEATPSSFVVVSYIKKPVDVYLIATFLASSEEADLVEDIVSQKLCSQRK